VGQLQSREYMVGVPAAIALYKHASRDVRLAAKVVPLVLLLGKTVAVVAAMAALAVLALVVAMALVLFLETAAVHNFVRRRCLQGSAQFLGMLALFSEAGRFESKPLIAL
jgi:hypothetical protein